MMLYDSPTCSVEWLEEGKILLKTMKGFVFGDETRKLFNAGYEKVLKEGGSKWLSDNRNLKPWKQEDVAFINEDWLPRMLKAGWKYWAIIEPEDTMGNLSMKNFIDLYQEQGLELKFFHNLEDAKAWLESLP